MTRRDREARKPGQATSRGSTVAQRNNPAQVRGSARRSHSGTASPRDGAGSLTERCSTVSPRDGCGPVSGHWTLLDGATVSDGLAVRRRRTTTGDWTLVDCFIALLPQTGACTMLDSRAARW